MELGGGLLPGVAMVGFYHDLGTTGVILSIFLSRINGGDKKNVLLTISRRQQSYHEGVYKMQSKLFLMTRQVMKTRCQ
jgi:hypothetical protein